MSKKELAILLSKLKTFEKADMMLEQHPTDSEVAGDALWQAFMQGDIEDKNIVDLGAGTGILGLGALLLGAKKAFLVDTDGEAISLAKENHDFLEKEIEKKLEAIYSIGDVSFFDEKADVVIMNPPFGTKNKNVDSQFLLKAMSIAPIIYSFHKASTKVYIDNFAKENDYEVTHYFEYFFPIKNTMKHHKKNIERIKVGLWRMVRLSIC